VSIRAVAGDHGAAFELARDRGNADRQQAAAAAIDRMLKQQK